MMSKDRDRISVEQWVFEKVDDFWIFEKFDCGDDDLNEFIIRDACPHKLELISETYSLAKIEKISNNMDLIAFVSLANDAIGLTTNKQKRPLDNEMRGYDTFPAVKITRLGVDKEYHGKMYGSLMIEIVKKIFTTNNRTGCRYLTVDAYNSPRVISFYQQNDFDFLHNKDADDDTRIMFFDLKRYVMESK